MSILITAALLVASIPATNAASPTGTPFEPLPPDVKIETVVPTTYQLVAMDFTPDGRLLYTERAGAVKVVQNGIVQTAYTFRYVATQGERGLLGIAVDPGFRTNQLVWVYYTRKIRSNPDQFENRVVRFVLPSNNVVTETKEVASFPVDTYITIHNGGNLHFGPDGKLYVTVGNNNETNDNSDTAQSLTTPLGKLHRFNPGVPLGIPGDNPFPNSSIYARGLRNSFDFTFDPITHAIFATENGDACDDEINRIVRGGNYGWHPFYPRPPQPCDDEVGPNPAYIPPLIYWTPSLAPTGIAFYTGDAIPEWKNDLFMCSFKDATTAVHHFKLNAARTAIVSHTILSDTVNHQPIQCRTDLLTGPDGALYFSYAGGYYNGPIKRITRPTSFIFSSAMANPLAVRAGDAITYTINVRHTGTLSNTFHLTATLLPSTTLEAISSGLTFDADHVYWSRSVSRTQSFTATYVVRAGASSDGPYLVHTPITITAPNATPVMLNTTVLVDGYPIFLPVSLRSH